jgi:hypothetical protein
VLLVNTTICNQGLLLLLLLLLVGIKEACRVH